MLNGGAAFLHHHKLIYVNAVYLGFRILVEFSVMACACRGIAARGRSRIKTVTYFYGL